MNIFINFNYLRKYYFNIFAIFIFSQIFTGCSPSSNEKYPPVNYPIALDKVGDFVEYEVTIEEKYFYTFGVMYFVNKDDSGDIDKLLKLLGEGRNAPHQVRVDINLIVLKLEGAASSVVFDKTVSLKNLVSVSEDGYFKEIAKLHLTPGVYRIKAENKLAVPDFSDRKVEFQLERSYMGK